MKPRSRSSLLLSLALLLPVFPGIARTPLSSGHVDIGIAYEGGAWDLHVHKEFPLPEEEFAPEEATILVAGGARLPGGVPANSPSVAFFGPAGSPLWVLPKTQDPNLIFLGLGAEELDPADWPSGLSLGLHGVSGPGSFFLWDVGSFGDLQPRMSSRDGIGSDDVVPIVPGSHGHYFMGFSAPGEYAIQWVASGTHTVGGVITSDPATYYFQVVPEPDSRALLAVGICVLIARRAVRATTPTRAA